MTLHQSSAIHLPLLPTQSDERTRGTPSHTELAGQVVQGCIAASRCLRRCRRATKATPVHFTHKESIGKVLAGPSGHTALSPYTRQLTLPTRLCAPHVLVGPEPKPSHPTLHAVPCTRMPCTRGHFSHAHSQGNPLSACALIKPCRCT